MNSEHSFAMTVSSPPGFLSHYPTLQCTEHCQEKSSDYDSTRRHNQILQSCAVGVHTTFVMENTANN